MSENHIIFFWVDLKLKYRLNGIRSFRVSFYCFLAWNIITVHKTIVTLNMWTIYSISEIGDIILSFINFSLLNLYLSYSFISFTSISEKNAPCRCGNYWWSNSSWFHWFRCQSYCCVLLLIDNSTFCTKYCYKYNKKWTRIQLHLFHDMINFIKIC